METRAQVQRQRHPHALQNNIHPNLADLSSGFKGLKILLHCQVICHADIAADNLQHMSFLAGLTSKPPANSQLRGTNYAIAK